MPSEQTNYNSELATGRADRSDAKCIYLLTPMSVVDELAKSMVECKWVGNTSRVIKYREEWGSFSGVE